MSKDFDASAIERHGWRQGAVLGSRLAGLAREHAPKGIIIADADWMIVMSHDCDVVNRQLEKEPTVEVLRATAVRQKKPDKQQVWGRNPREMQFVVDDGAGGCVVLSAKVHERWQLPRDLLMIEAPARMLGDKQRRPIAEWLAKRYIRAAFPNAFDARWRTRMKEWIVLLEKQSKWIQGVYLRLSSLAELDDGTPYKIDFIVAAPVAETKEPGWAAKSDEIEKQVAAFWKQFAPGIECVDVEVLSTKDVTLAGIAKYQRFDADWVSFADDSPATPHAADMKE